MNRACALVTGASRGIGAACAEALAAEGFDIVLNYVSSNEAAHRVTKICKEKGGSAIAVQADISNQEERQLLLAKTRAAFGRLDLLVNNAGVAPNVRADILELTQESYDRVLSVNLSGTFWLTQDVAKWMIDQRREDQEKRCTIINISSISSFTSSPNRAAYCISKAGLSMATKLYADRLAQDGISVHEIQPGIIRTDMTSGSLGKYEKLIESGLLPITRFGEPKDVAAAVVMLASGGLPYTTGEVIRVDGGFHIRRLH